MARSFVQDHVVRMTGVTEIEFESDAGFTRIKAVKTDGTVDMHDVLKVVYEYNSGRWHHPKSTYEFDGIEVSGNLSHAEAEAIAQEWAAAASRAFRKQAK